MRNESRTARAFRCAIYTRVSTDSDLEQDSNSLDNQREASEAYSEVFVAAIANAHRWLDELLSDPAVSITALAKRERKSERSIRMTLSLAMLAPDLAKAAIDGDLPRGFNTTRLIDLPMIWSEQWPALGLQRPIDDR